MALTTGHVATHRWLEESAVDHVRAGSPMVLCGLALAGANLPPDEFGRAPGRLTAKELAALDLSGCELAVLSACDTSRGQLRRAGQGVASLQRALHMAGAARALTSLWPVPDEATRALMLDFYRRAWRADVPYDRALWEAKYALREAGHPTRDWAGWLLSGPP